MPINDSDYFFNFSTPTPRIAESEVHKSIRPSFSHCCFSGALSPMTWLALFLPVHFQFDVLAFRESLCLLQHCVRAFKRPPIDGMGVTLRIIQHPYQRRRCCVVGEDLQRAEIVGAVRGWNDNAFLFSGNKLRVHHDARHPPIAVDEGMHFAYQGRHEHGPLEWLRECLQKFETFLDRAVHKVGCNKNGTAGLVVFRLEAARILVWPRFHDAGMAATQQCDKFIDALGYPARMERIERRRQSATPDLDDTGRF